MVALTHVIRRWLHSRDRVATPIMAHVCGSFSVKEPYSYLLLCGNGPKKRMDSMEVGRHARRCGIAQDIVYCNTLQHSAKEVWYRTRHCLLFFMSQLCLHAVILDITTVMQY